MATQSVSLEPTYQSQRKSWLVPLLSRLVMLPPVLVFTVISVRFLTNTRHAVSGVILTTPESFTDLRVEAAWVMTLLVLLLTFISSRKHLWLGHLQLSLFMGLTLVVRIFGFMHDGTTLAMGNQRAITIVEVVFLVLNLVGLVVQTRLIKQNGAKR